MQKGLKTGEYSSVSRLTIYKGPFYIMNANWKGLNPYTVKRGGGEMTHDTFLLITFER